MSGKPLYVDGRPVYVYSYNPESGLRTVFQYRDHLQETSLEIKPVPYLKACSSFDTFPKRKIFQTLGFLSRRTRRSVESKLTRLATTSLDWTKIRLLNVKNVVHLVFIDYKSQDGVHLVHPSVHLYEELLSEQDLEKICTEQFSRMSGEFAAEHRVFA